MNDFRSIDDFILSSHKQLDMAELTLSVFLQIVQTVGVLVGIVYYITIMRTNQKTRELSLKAQEAAEKARKREMIMLRSQTYTMEYARAFIEYERMEEWTTVEEFDERYGIRNNPEAFANVIYIRNLFNSAGLMLKEEGVDPELLFQLYAPGAVVSLWEKQLMHVESVRERFNYPELYSGFEYLYNEAKKRFPDITYPSVQLRR
jgi:hypothetical protein